MGDRNFTVHRDDRKLPGSAAAVGCGADVARRSSPFQYTVRVCAELILDRLRRYVHGRGMDSGSTEHAAWHGLEPWGLVTRELVPHVHQGHMGSVFIQILARDFRTGKLHGWGQSCSILVSG